MQGRRRDTAAVPDAPAKSSRPGAPVGPGRRTGRSIAKLAPRRRRPRISRRSGRSRHCASPVPPIGARCRCTPRPRGRRLLQRIAAKHLHELGASVQGLSRDFRSHGLSVPKCSRGSALSPAGLLRLPLRRSSRTRSTTLRPTRSACPWSFEPWVIVLSCRQCRPLRRRPRPPVAPRGPRPRRERRAGVCLRGRMADAGRRPGHAARSDGKRALQRSHGAARTAHARGGTAARARAALGAVGVGDAAAWRLA